MLFIPLIITLLATIVAQAQVLPAPGVDDPTPSFTTANFAKTTNKISGTKTKVDDNKSVITKIISQTVTTGKYRSGKSKPAIVTGKLAGIIIAAVVGTIIILVIAILLYKRRQKKRATADKQQEEEGEGDGIGHDEKDIEIGGGPIVPGEMAYTSQPANLHSDRPGASIPEQPKVVGPEADRAVVDSNK